MAMGLHLSAEQAAVRRLAAEGATVAAVAFLAGDDASYVSGQTRYVSGGAR
ncbi:hypothetical protein [Micromonospora echinospora]|uniref:hypothetical protein n=1 Tax=Micromonospora echinospora TaxID=1877 RepID=UPI003A88C2F2